MRLSVPRTFSLMQKNGPHKLCAVRSLWLIFFVMPPLYLKNFQWKIIR